MNRTMLLPFATGRLSRMPVPALLLPPLPPDSVLHTLSAYSEAERAAMQRDCRECGALTLKPCITATGLAASQPCPGRGTP